MKVNKAAAIDCAISAETVEGGDDQMINTTHAFCSEMYTTLSPPRQLITNVIIPLPQKGDLSLMTNCHGTSLISIAAKVYNKIPLNRMKPRVDPCWKATRMVSNQAANSAPQIHRPEKNYGRFQGIPVPLTLNFVNFKKAFDSINRSVMFSILRHYGIPKAVFSAIQVVYTNSSNAVMVDEGFSESFDVTTGVLQRWCISPFLFII